MEFISGAERRRRWRCKDKLRTLAEIDRGAKLNDVARRHDVGRGLLWQWREAQRRGRLVLEEPSFVPVRVAGELPPPERGDAGPVRPCRFRDRRRCRRTATTPSRSSCPTERCCGWRRGSRCGVCCRRCAGDPRPLRCARLARGRACGYASWDEWVGTAGAGGARARPARGRSLRVSWAQRRPAEDFVARRARDVALCEEVGARAVPVAEGDGRRGPHLRVAAVLHARRDRPEEPAIHAQAAGRGVARQRRFRWRRARGSDSLGM